MTPPAHTAHYKNHRFPGEIISHGVWLYYRLPQDWARTQNNLGDALATLGNMTMTLNC